MSRSSPSSQLPKAERRVEEWSMGYAMVYASVALARRHALRRLAMWGWAGDTYDAVLIVSELVSNAISHGRRVGHELSLRLATLECGTLVIEVSDPVADFPGFDRCSEPGEDAESGRGLLVVRLLGGEVTWYPRPHIGKTVRVSLPSHPSSA
ncbi:ATP-binding protein [Streptomyces sp. ISL-96]|uniref:ATP-binding protein n=1 Tax=Streptomyces sp. ISL-96 TaxID=2819191 RepID=UPI001BE9232F|nr:ATP-binding protein [Streptomyces sp. ISL-96]MBT2489062.1 ATP-binding protein [Streptomyces sp. ISL-96]